MFKTTAKTLTAFDLLGKNDVERATETLLDDFLLVAVPLLDRFQTLNDCIAKKSTPVHLKNRLEANQFSRLGLIYCLKGLEEAVAFIKNYPSRFALIGANIAVERLLNLETAFASIKLDTASQWGHW